MRVPQVTVHSMERSRWRQFETSSRRSIAAEVLSLLEQNIPTEKELKARQALLRQMERMRAKKPLTRGPFPSTEELQREDRLR